MKILAHTQTWNKVPATAVSIISILIYPAGPPQKAVGFKAHLVLGRTTRKANETSAMDAQTYLLNPQKMTEIAVL